MYKIFEVDDYITDLEKNIKLKNLRQKLESKVYTQLRANPVFGPNIKKLKNYKPDTWRYRISDYRFFYEIDHEEKIVFMIAAEHRKDCY